MTRRNDEHWASRMGVILAVAGSAIGLGSFLRFPTQAAQYGGAFLIPYLVVLLFIGLPLMWLEWSFGRYGGIWGKHTLPGIYEAATGKSWARYLGVLGLYIPFVIVVYYLYVESWTLAYSFFTATNQFAEGHGAADYLHTFRAFLGMNDGRYAFSWLAVGVLVLTLVINFVVAAQDERRGLERLTSVAMPLLFLLSVALVVRVFTLPGVEAGLGHLWKPDLGKLVAPMTLFGHTFPFLEPKVWLAALGQVFFTLNLGLGTVLVGASYLRKDDDTALSGLTAVSLNEFGEVVLGASIALPAGIALLGASTVLKVAADGPYTLGLVTIPLIFERMPFGSILGAVWFVLIFFAAVGASIALLQPIIGFFVHEIGWSRRKATMTLLVMTLLYLVPVVLFQRQGFMAEMDFNAVNLLLAFGALVELIMFLGVLGIERGWQGITAGARLRLPRLWKSILCYVTPTLLIVILLNWFVQVGDDAATLVGIPDEFRKFHILSRVCMAVALLGMLLVVRAAWRRPLPAPDAGPEADLGSLLPPDDAPLIAEEVPGVH